MSAPAVLLEWSPSRPYRSHRRRTRHRFAAFLMVFTATMLAASGVGKTRILIWQAIAIIAWTTLTALIISGVLQAVR